MRIGPLEIGGGSSVTVRREEVGGYDLKDPVRILYASDLHLGWAWSESLIEELLDAAQTETPGIILLGGDLIDRENALPLLESLVENLSKVAPVWAISGNHDRVFGVADIRNAVEKGGGNWLEGEKTSIRSGGVRLSIEGSLHRREAGEIRILCAHRPDIFPNAVKAGFDVVLAGHLHGGQCVIATVDQVLYPGAFFSRWHGLRFIEENATMIVSRGAADTLPLRWNCPREVILCEIY